MTGWRLSTTGLANVRGIINKCEGNGEMKRRRIYMCAGVSVLCTCDLQHISLSLQDFIKSLWAFVFNSHYYNGDKFIIVLSSSDKVQVVCKSDQTIQS